VSFSRLAELIVDRPRVLVAATVLLIVAGVALALPFKNGLLGLGYQVPGSESDRAAQIIQRDTGFTESDLLVVSSNRYRYGEPQFTRALDAAIAAVRRQDGGALVLAPGQRGGGQVSADRVVATVTVAMKGDVAHRQDVSANIQPAVRAAVGPGFSAGLTGDSPVLRDLVHIEEIDTLKAEGIGFPIAIILLLLAFGAAMAALLPLMMAYGGVLGAIAVIAALLVVQSFNAFTETFVVMFGLALGIDYSLLFVRRFREERKQGGSDREVIERTLRTAGRTVLFSGSIFSVALIPVIPTKLPFFYDSAIAVIVVVVVEVLLLLTLLPVVLLKLGDNLDRGRLPGRFGAGGLGESSPTWHRWAHGVMRRPIPFLAVGVAVLAVAASPLLHIKTAITLNESSMAGEPSVQPIATLAKHFPNAQVAPIEVVVRGTPPLAGAARAVMTRAGLGGTEQVQLARGGTLLLGTSATKIDSLGAFNQIKNLRGALDTHLPHGAALVGGVTAETVDYAKKTDRYQWWVIAGSLTLSFILLLCVFRSPVLATKAIVMNLISVGAALGLTVFLFQDGHAQSVLGFKSPGYLQAWTPLTLFIMLFGISMDYELFMVTRIREEYDRLGDTREAVARGLERTGSVVTYAALIMATIFGAFILSTIPEMKQLGFALAASVLIDATIVRTMLVPAFMRIAGRWNWWIPGWLDRALPAVKHSDEPAVPV
jgi:RND superfamily putative drug exporter